MSFLDFLYLSISLFCVVLTVGMLVLGYKIWRLIKSMEEVVVVLKEKMEKFNPVKDFFYGGGIGLLIKFLSSLFKRR